MVPGGVFLIFIDVCQFRKWSENFSLPKKPPNTYILGPKVHTFYIKSNFEVHFSWSAHFLHNWNFFVPLFPRGGSIFGNAHFLHNLKKSILSMIIIRLHKNHNTILDVQFHCTYFQTFYACVWALHNSKQKSEKGNFPKRSEKRR